MLKSYLTLKQSWHSCSSWPILIYLPIITEHLYEQPYLFYSVINKNPVVSSVQFSASLACLYWHILWAAAWVTSPSCWRPPKVWRAASALRNRWTSAFAQASTQRPDEFVATLVSLLCAVGPQTCRGADPINQQLFCSGYDASPRYHCLFWLIA